MVILESTPTQRTIRYADYYTSDPVRSYRILVPYLRYLVGVRPAGRHFRGPGFSSSNYNGAVTLRIFGSMEPVESIDQPVFALPFPNMRIDGAVCMGYSISSIWDTPEEAAYEVLNTFWGSQFTYFIDPVPGPNTNKRRFERLLLPEFGAYRNLATPYTLSKFITI